MAFKGITFAGQNVTPKNDGGLYQAHYGDGILWGCSMAISGDDLVIQSGEFIMGGRVVQVDGATSVDLSGRQNNTGYIQVIMNADMTQAEGSQWYTSFVESATTTFPALTQDDINDNGDLYQLELAVIEVSGGNLTSIYSSLRLSPLVLNAVSDAQNLFFMDGNDYMGRLSRESGGNILLARTSNLGAYGNGYGNGIYMPTGGAVRIFGNNGSIYLRPNGITSTTGQVQFDTTGQQIGGHPLTTETPADVSLTANTITSLKSITGLSSSGIYVAYGKITYTPSVNTAHYPELRISGSTADTTVRGRQSIYSASTGVKYLTVSVLFTGLSQIGLYAHTHSSSVSGTASDIRFEVVRLA